MDKRRFNVVLNLSEKEKKKKRHTHVHCMINRLDTLYVCVIHR